MSRSRLTGPVLLTLALAAGAGAQSSTAPQGVLLGGSLPAPIEIPSQEVVASTAARGKLSPSVASLVRVEPGKEVTLIVSLKAQGRARAAAAGRESGMVEDVPFVPADRTASETAQQRQNSGAENERRLEENRRVFHRTQEAVASRAEAEGGRILYRLAYNNVLVLRMQAVKALALAELPEVDGVELDQNMQAGLGEAVASIGASTFWTAGFDGTGVQVAILDTGVDLTHPTFASAPKSSQVFLASGSNDPCFMDVVDTDDRAGHGTHVGGIALGRASGECTACKGVAKGGTLVSRKVGYKDSCSSGGNHFLWADTIAAFDSVAAVSVINFSVGGVTSLDQTYFSTEWDRVVQSGKFVTLCAGNSGPQPGIWDPAVAYNAVAVANVDDRGSANRSDDIIYSTSSRGPTPAGRKKPDLAAPGTVILSARFDWETTSDYWNFTGTSMAAPQVAGAAALLMNAGITDAKAVKAVLINTAESRGTTGWDPAWGWGYLDLNTAYQNLTGFVSAVTPKGQTGAMRLYRGSTSTFGKATLVWNRRPDLFFTCSGTGKPLNDLNLYGYDENSNQAIAESISGVDNVEQILVANRPTMVVKVAAACESFGGGSAEAYALATPPGFAPAEFPTPSLQLSSLSYTPNSDGTVSATITNPSSVAAHNLALTLTLPPGFALTSGNANPVATRLDAGQSLTYNWGVHSPVAEGNQQATLSVAQNSYGQATTDTVSANWGVAPAQLQYTPGALDFGGNVRGRLTSPKSFTVQNNTNVNITIASIAASGDFSLTHDCPSVLIPAAGCTFLVTFLNNSSPGAVHGAVTITSNTPSSPNTVALTAVSLDFTLALNRPKRPARNATSAAQSQSFELVVTPVAGMGGEVQFWCEGMLPGVRCEVAPPRERLRDAPLSARVIVSVAGRSRRLKGATTLTHVLKVHATVEGITKTIDLPVQVER